MTGERISATRQFALVEAKIGALPPALKAEILRELVAFQPRFLARMQAGVPTRSGPRPTLYARSRPGANRPVGGGVTLLSTKIDEQELRLSGGLLTKDARERGFYLFILDAGRGLKRRVSDSRARMLKQAPSLVRGFGGGMRNRFSVRYTRKISPILPGRYAITFGAARTWARAEIGPVLDRVYVQAVAAAGW